MNYLKKDQQETSKIFEKNEGKISNIIKSVFKGKSEEKNLKNTIPKDRSIKNNKDVIYKPPIIPRSSSTIQGCKGINCLIYKKQSEVLNKLVPIQA